MVVYVLVLTIYSASGPGWFPFLPVRKHLEESEITPIFSYESKGFNGRGGVSTLRGGRYVT